MAEGLPQRAKAYLLENFNVDYRKYDIIIGYRANDSYFSYTGDFVNGTLSLSDLSKFAAAADMIIARNNT